jgi:hypothetical protein
MLPQTFCQAFRGPRRRVSPFKERNVSRFFTGKGQADGVRQNSEMGVTQAGALHSRVRLTGRTRPGRQRPSCQRPNLDRGTDRPHPAWRPCGLLGARFLRLP